jgi:hypothetical protein
MVAVARSIGATPSSIEHDDGVVEVLVVAFGGALRALELDAVGSSL